MESSSNNESERERYKCQPLYFKRYSLQRQTLDHDPLATVFLGHFRNRASLHCFILTHKESHVQYTHQQNIYTDAMATEKAMACLHRYKGRRMRARKGELRGQKSKQRSGSGWVYRH